MFIPYDLDKLHRMYRWLEQHGELYWIELQQGDGWRPVGDVTFWEDDLPIVIGEKALRGQGIGGQVIAALIQRGRALGYSELHVREIFSWNHASRRMFERAGFLPYRETEQGRGYRLLLRDKPLFTEY